MQGRTTLIAGSSEPPLGGIHEQLGRIGRKLAGLRSAVSATRATLPFYPCLSEAALLALEKRHRVQLPNEYRAFLLHFGNGGTGLDFNILPLGNDWHEVNPTFDSPFPFSATDMGEQTEFEVPSIIKWTSDHPVPGCLTIAEEYYCNATALLVLNGDFRGAVWLDHGWGELAPCRDQGGTTLHFLAWYEQELLDPWLKEISRHRPIFLPLLGDAMD